LIWFLRILLLSSFISFAIPTFAANAARGGVVAKVRCAPCHHLSSPYKQVGPSLLGIYGKKPSITGVPFEVWDKAALQAWLSNPRDIKANTKMRIPKLSARDRDDIVAWLASL